MKKIIGIWLAGATIKLTTDGSNLNIAQTTQTVWFKPFDFLKVSLGNYDFALNKETILWTESITGLGGNGYAVSVNVSGFAFDLFLNQGNNNVFWFVKDNESDPAIAEFGVKVGYSADFGSIGAFVDINRTGNIDAFGFGLFAAPVIWTNADLNEAFEMQIVAKLSYALNGVTPYIQFKDNNIVAKKFTSKIQVGASGNLGLMGWKVWAQVETGDIVKFSIPFELTVSF